MAAIVVDATTGQERITLSATPDQTQQVTLPTWARRVSIIPQGAAVKFAMSGTDGAALGADFLTIPDATSFYREVLAPLDRNVGRSVYVASATASAVFVVIAERDSQG